MHVIETTRLTLEPQLAAHAPEMFEVLRDPAIYEFENEPPRSVEWLQARFALLEARVSPDGGERWLNWVLRLRDGPLIGYVQGTVQSGRRALIGYELASRHWGLGLASEAVAAMLRELRCVYQVDLALAILKSANTRSLRLLERLEFEPAPAQVFSALSVEPDESLMCRRLARPRDSLC